jgi:molybdopterin synthase catalytic subunit
MRRLVKTPECGGVVIFLGEVRGQTGGQTTEKLQYEAYADMAHSQMLAIAEEAANRWSARVAVAHRLGELAPGEIAVVTVAACAHRAEAFDCCRFLIDRIKADVPIWKKEFSSGGAEWRKG